MKLQELVDELRENVLRDISDAVNTDTSSYLLSDKSLVRYLNEAQNRFADKTQCLRDETTPAVTRLALVAGIDSYALDPRVVAVLGARTRQRHLRLRPYGSIVTTRGNFNTGYPLDTEVSDGSPTYYYTDRETGKIGLWPAPNPDFALNELILRVARLPLKPLVAEDLSAIPEVPEQYHMSLVDWAAYRCLTNNDIELQDQIKANSRKNRFNETVEELKKDSKRLLLNEIAFDVNSNWR